ncbi:hypothetical protein JQC92_13865 [Shewanella sp. 202IG2-18]|uniref:hypothetical protein n=1 Tax=Parashewanella hymeniacidonis TaxID=2807618 RepID=UPI001960BFD5|nr:hypothetical protein [Parashewanella hymeniacidonis]MBM7073103.1 hypothetical protein [Parashewanella hymeniacidonis]
MSVKESLIPNTKLASYDVVWDSRKGRAQWVEQQKLKSDICEFDKWQKVEFSFNGSGGGEPYKRKFEVKKVKLDNTDGTFIESFQIREASRIKRFAPDILFKSKYRIELDNIFDVDGPSCAQTDNELSTKTTLSTWRIPNAQWASGVTCRCSGIGQERKNQSGHKDKLNTVNIEPLNQDLSANCQITNNRATIQVPLEIRKAGHQPMKMKAVSSIADVTEAIPTQQQPPLFVFDIDETLVYKKGDISAGITDTEAVESEINEHLNQLQQKFPDAHFIIVSHALGIERKLNLAKITVPFKTLFEPKIDSKTQFKESLDKGETIKEYMKKNGLEGRNVVFIDDNIDAHHEVADKFDEDSVQHFLFLGATESKVNRNAQLYNSESEMFDDNEHFLFSYNLYNSIKKIRAENARVRRKDFKVAYKKFMSQQFPERHRCSFTHFYKF